MKKEGIILIGGGSHIYSALYMISIGNEIKICNRYLTIKLKYVKK